MIESEIAFAHLSDGINLAEDYLKVAEFGTHWKCVPMICNYLKTSLSGKFDCGNATRIFSAKSLSEPHV